MNINFKTVSARDLQTNYRKIFDEVNGDNEPVFVMSKNKPDVVIVSISYLNNLKSQLEWEVEDTKDALRIYDKEKTTKKLKILKSPKELLY